jgi:gliding motility-associated-like protein
MYTAYVSDIHNCVNSDSLIVNVQQPPILSVTPDTTIIIGEIVNLMATSDQPSVTYVWSPPTGLTCLYCENPDAQPLQDITYVIMISDSMNCFHPTDTVHIKVTEEYSLDVPKAFTPNGDGNNDIIYVRGWGIQSLLEFKIYNRWGECVFESDDMHRGWDGTFKGISQNIDSYAYTVKAQTWSGKILTKSGLFNLLR